jgi:DNA-binding MarR family transcriptional regulator
MLPMLPPGKSATLDLGILAEDEARMGADVAVRLRTFRLVLIVANMLRSVLDRRLADDDLTTQQATILTVARVHGAPSLKQCAAAIGTSHQNVKQLALALERKGFLRIVPDAEDGRVRRLVTTKKNERYWATRDGADHEVILRAFAELSAAEARELFRLLAKVRAGADTLS